MSYAFDWSSIPRAWPFLADGMAVTAVLLAVGMTLGIAFGTGLAVVRIYAPRPIALLAAGYVNFFRSVPLILTIFWVFFLVPPLLRTVTANPYLSASPIWSALAAFVLAEAAYYCEIVRAGIGSVGPGQMRATQALGLSRIQALRYVIVPQALRNMAPSLANQTVSLLKDTPLVYVVSLTDFLGAAAAIGNRDGRIVELYVFAAVVYLALCSLGTWLADLLQARSRRRMAAQ